MTVVEKMHVPYNTEMSIRYSESKDRLYFAHFDNSCQITSTKNTGTMRIMHFYTPTIRGRGHTIYLYINSNYSCHIITVLKILQRDL